MEYHFRHEEGLMQSIGFADYKTHCAEHKRIIEEATHMLKTCRTTDRLLGRLRHLMLDWVTRHIMQEDAQVGRCRSRSGQSNHPLL
jgi:hemerythrin-like metal-binding protein